MNARGGKRSRNTTIAGWAMRMRRLGAVRLASVLLLSLPAAWASADAGCSTPMLDDLLWNSTQCEFAQHYLDACGSQGRHVRKARECIEWDKVRKCEQLEKVVAFRKLFPGGAFAPEADACIARLESDKRLQACRLHHAIETKFECFQEVLKMDRFNLEALEEVDNIRQDILNSADAAMTKKDEAVTEEDIAALETAINDMERMFPRDRALKGLRDRLAEVSDVIRERHERRQAQKDLEDRVRKLIGQKKFEEALVELQKPRDPGVSGKTLESLEREAREGLERAKSRRAREAALAEAQGLRDAEDFDGARRKLKEARGLGLPEKTYVAESKAIDEAERTQRARATALAEAQKLRKRGDFAGARRQLEKALALGLPKKAYNAELEAIALAEREIQRLAKLQRECQDHMDGARMVDSLTCYRRVLELEPGNREAGKQVPLLEMFVAWLEVDKAGTVKQYYAFEEKYKERRDLDGATHLTQLAREKLNSKQVAFWGSVKSSGSREMYELYVSIFPQGRYVREAREWLENEG